MKQTKYDYTLHLTKIQAMLLSWACDRIARIIEGQDWTYQEFFEQAWEKRCKEATGNFMDKEWDGGWDNMRHEAEEISKAVKKRFWGCEANTMYGIYYDPSADVLWDVHQVIRHQLWLDRPEEGKSHITVDSDEAMQFGNEPLCKIEKV